MKDVFAILTICIVFSTSIIAQSEGNNILLAQNKNDKWGFVDSEGNVKIKFTYTYAENFQDGFAIVVKGGKEYETSLYDGKIIGRIGGKCGIINTKGEVVVPLIYDEIFNYKDDLARVRKGNYCGFVDKKGKVVIPIIYEVAWSFSEGLAAVKKSKWGYIDKSNNVVIQFLYDLCGPFQEGLANVCIGNLLNPKWGYVDTKGKIIIPLEYSSASPFKNGLAKVKQGAEEFFIDKKGNQK